MILSISVSSSLHEFKECLHNHGFHDDDDIQRLYEAIDHDHTGQVKYSEFIAACVQEDLYNQEERVVEAFNRLDVDHDGTISKKDLKTMLGDELDDSAIERILDDAAFHRDGLIHLDDFKRMMRGEHASQNAHQD